MQYPTAAKKYRGNQEIKFTVQHAVDDTIIQEVEDKKLSEKFNHKITRTPI